ncbi:MAG: hypothetical protein HFJ34_06125 [Clostridia bacterium]|nr:hypothetical protein [Clostridia bacterium]
MKNKIYLIVGIIVFILILTSSHILLNVKSGGSEKEKQTIVSGENITHTGKFLIPIENYIKMTCKYRNKNTSNYKKTILSYWCRFSRK